MRIIFSRFMYEHIPADLERILLKDAGWHLHGYPANTKHLYNICTTSAQRLRRWSNLVQMLYKYFVFTG